MVTYRPIDPEGAVRWTISPELQEFAGTSSWTVVTTGRYTEGPASAGRGSRVRGQAVQRSVEQRAKGAAQSIQFLKESVHRSNSFLGGGRSPACPLQQ